MGAVMLGIDLGTTSVKVAAKLSEDRIIEKVFPHNASLGQKGVQDAKTILKIAKELIEIVRKELVQEVDTETNEPFLNFVGVSCQMHGVVMWNKCDVEHNNWAVTPSPLYTWEFDGYDKSIMQILEGNNGPMQAGFGCTTLAYLHEKGEIGDHFDRAGTIGDLFVAILLGDRGNHKMTTQLANSFGFCKGKQWTGMAAAEGRWQIMLPEIVEPEELAGDIKNLKMWEKQNVDPPKLFYAMGDLQATLYQRINANTIALNVGTSSQFAFTRELNTEFEQFEQQQLHNRPHCRFDPYFNKSEIIVCASMNGGNMVERGITAGFESLKEVEFAALMNDADKFARENGVKDETQRSAVSCEGLAFPERGTDGVPAPLAIVGLSGKTEKKEVVLAVCNRVIDNLFSLLPIPDFHTKLLLMGSADKPRFKYSIECKVNEINSRRDSENQLTIETAENCNAAAGAAAFAECQGMRRSQNF